MSAPLILVVDDDDDIRESFLEVLDENGYRAIGAADGREALDLLADGAKPDAILLDLMMPRMNGRQFRDAQRRDPALAGIPVILISAHNDVAQQADDLEPAAFLKKPSSMREILEAVRGCVGPAAASRFAPPR